MREPQNHCIHVWDMIVCDQRHTIQGESMTSYYAHSGRERDRSDWQILHDHLISVATLARDMASPFGLGAAAYFAGLFHDLGKYTAEFQQRLTGADIRVDHSTAGAVAMLGDLARGRDKGMTELIAYCIAGHHAGLPDRLNGTSACLERRRETKLPALDPIWQSELAAEVSGLVPSFRIKPGREDAAFQYSVMGRMIFSCLVDADFKDTERFYTALEGRRPDRQWPALQTVLPGFIAAFDAHMQGKADTSSSVNRLRQDILAHVRGKAAEAPGLFTLTVPTGGGKTLASLGFALDHAIAHGHSRIIYAIPFTRAWIETSRRRWATRHRRSPSPRGPGSKLD